MLSQKSKVSKGSMYILLSTIFFGSYGIWSKLMADDFDVFSQAWLRGVVVVVILLPVGIALKSFRKVRLRDLKWFVIVTIPGSLVLPFYYYGFINLSMGNSTILFYSALTLTAYVLGIIFFGEKLSWVKTVALILGMSGLATIFSISISSSSLVPALITFAAGVCGGIEVVFTKKLSGRY
ncbi:MAG: DMT family transporter, partial [Patescibacteria group bacterium]|nr:DMT family transporter [Patescibacteria group bacterium]